jgi:antitoxin (DNA-binding transcriptional repressor) of toxin-antitoxin stability system
LLRYPNALPLKGSTRYSVYEIMAIYDMAYAEAHLAELFHEARLGEQVIIVRSDGKACELTPIADVEQDEPLAEHLPIPADPQGTGDLVPV